MQNPRQRILLNRVPFWGVGLSLSRKLSERLGSSTKGGSKCDPFGRGLDLVPPAVVTRDPS